MLFCKTKSNKIVKGYQFFSFQINLSNKKGKQLLDTTAQTLTVTLKKVVCKVAEETSEFTGNKIADKIEKPKPAPDK